MKYGVLIDMSKEFYNELRNDSKNHFDRYRNCKILVDKETGERLLSTREIDSIVEYPTDYYHRVESHEVDRLDLIAHKYYKNPLLWWVIAQANDIHDPFIALEPGTLLRIPSLESLYGNNGILL